MCSAASIGELERTVMDSLWEEDGNESTVRDVAEKLPDHAYTTVATVLDRLVQKGLVSRRRSGRSILFAATITRAHHTATLMHEALATAGDSDAALVRFAETVSKAEAEILRRTLGEPERKP
ncbi:MAG TPA: BlaI/MecI/CopY family transcriptional regulator [Acidimicrobiales bacterium]|nr:BlaI/MecI/CopY family transcriptional regulator [Acidimicrobiales bacterium]